MYSARLKVPCRNVGASFKQRDYMDHRDPFKGDQGVQGKARGRAGTPRGPRIAEGVSPSPCKLPWAFEPLPWPASGPLQTTVR